MMHFRRLMMMLLGLVCAGASAQPEVEAQLPDELRWKAGESRDEHEKRLARIPVATKLNAIESLKLAPCPFVADRIAGICNDVYKQFYEPEESLYTYQYERKFYEVSCADITKDSELVAAAKIRSMWAAHQNDQYSFKCDKANFDVAYGSLLKYAIRMQTYDLIDRAADMWFLDLNGIDKTDGRTLLDYVEFEAADPNPTQERTLRQYCKLLPGKGAKHARELTTPVTPSDAVKPRLKAR